MNPEVRALFIAILYVAGSCPSAGQSTVHAESTYAEQDVSAIANLNSPFWRGAASVIAPNDTYGNPVGGHRTEVKSRWTSKNIYFLFVCPYLSIAVQISSLTAGTREGRRLC